MTDCPCCGNEDIHEGHSSPPYLCEGCEYIDDTIGDWLCETCGLHMCQMAALMHQSYYPSHDVHHK